MGWLQDIQDAVGDVIAAVDSGNGDGNGKGTSRNRSRRAPGLDYLTATERRTPQPGRDWQTGMHRFDVTIPDDYFIASRHDVASSFRKLRASGTMPRTIPLGMCGGTWMQSKKDNHVLAIAPPRSDAGKTAGLIIPAVLSHPNPVVTVSTKMDVLRATAMARAQHGELWCYAPGGAADIPEGVKELRWSPIAGAGDWQVAVSTATAMTGILDTSTMKSGDHWKERAGDLLAAVFHWAALTGRTMRDARNAIYRADQDDLRNIALVDLPGAGGVDAAQVLHSVVHATREEFHSILSSAARALKAYRTEPALRSTDNPNFDIVDFVNGGNDYPVRADTVYITGRSDEQELVAPLVVGFLTEIQRQVYRRHRCLSSAGFENTRAAAPILFALDELYGLAPLPTLPNMLSEGGSQGLLITAAIQDLSLIEKRWPKLGGAFMTMFGTVLVYPGIRDVQTLRAVSDLLGHHDREKRDRNVKRQAAEPVPFLGRYEGPYEDQEEGASIKSERVPRFDIHEVMRGPVQGCTDVVFLFGGAAWTPVAATPYFRSAPWPMLLTSYLERAVSGRVPEWRYWEAHLSKERPNIDDTLPRLPAPPLDTWAEDPGAHPCDRVWAHRYRAALARRDELRSRAPRIARWEPGWAHDNGEMWVVTDSRGWIPHTIRRLTDGNRGGAGDAEVDLVASEAWTPAPEHRAAVSDSHAVDDVERRSESAVTTAASDKQRAEGTGTLRDPQTTDTDIPDPISEVTPAHPISERQRWEPDWSIDDAAEATEWIRGGRRRGETPDCYHRALAEMEAAVWREKVRRREVRDDRSVTLFDTERARINRRRRRHPRPDDAGPAEAGGFWTLLPPDAARLFRAFLCGDELAPVYGEGPGTEAGEPDDESGQGRVQGAR